MMFKVFTFLAIFFQFTGEEPPYSIHKFPTSDGVTLYSHLLSTNQHKDTPTIILFHMAGSNSVGEYENYAKELFNLGYNVLLVDTRSGGDRFNHNNLTVKQDDSLAKSEYCDASLDVESSIQYVHNNISKGPIVLVGSSFSGGLVINAASKYKELVKGFVAFSPASGAPMAGCEPENSLNQDLKGLIIRPESELKYDWIKEQSKQFSEFGIDTISVNNGVHGVSTIIDSRMKEDLSSIRDQINNKINGYFQSSDIKLSHEVDRWKIISMKRSLPGKKILLLFNQAAGSSNQYTDLVNKLAKNNISSIRVDLRGHGASTNLGTFDPAKNQDLSMITQANKEIQHIITYTLQTLEYNIDDLYIVTASYSTEEAVKALMKMGTDVNHIALSPGSLSNESIDYLSHSDKNIVVYKSSNEHAFFLDLFNHISKQAPNVKRVTIKGQGHGVSILEKNPDVIDEIIQIVR